MKRGLFRTTAIGALFIFATILFVKFLYRNQNSNIKEKDDFELIRQQQQKQRPIEATPDEKFMSFFPHG
jgi:preprotein translocase subunit SecG